MQHCNIATCERILGKMKAQKMMLYFPNWYRSRKLYQVGEKNIIDIVMAVLIIILNMTWT